MKLTVEHAIIGVLALALIYYIVQHRNLLDKHINLKVVQGKHNITIGELANRSRGAGLDGWMPPGKDCTHSSRYGSGTADELCQPWWNAMNDQGLL